MSAIKQLAIPIAATAEVLLEGLQAREIPVAQDPTTVSAPDDAGPGPDARRTLRSGHEANASG